MKRHLLVAVLSAGLLRMSGLAVANVSQRPLWRSGEDGYHTFRIPAITVTPQDTLLAFCEGRKGSRSDSGDIDLLMKRSSDGWTSWSEQQVLWDDGANTCGNPSVVVDARTGVIWLLVTWNRGDDHERQIIDRQSKDTRRVFVLSSADDGLTWTSPKEITTDVKKSDWTWYATGPGSGIQIQRGAHVGRLVIPCDHIEAATKHYYSHVIFSDDQGQTWRLGGRTSQHQVNECQVVELADGRLMLNMRNYNRKEKRRQIAFSADGGLTWTDQGFDGTLIEPICQAGLLRYAWPDSATGTVVLFSNPASVDQRINMTVRASFDEGETWAKKAMLHAGPSAYSDLAVLDDGIILCLYERGDRGPYEGITLARIGLEDLKGE